MRPLLLLLLPGAGGTAQEIGGPLDKEGAVGKQFTTEGSIGEFGALSGRVGRGVARRAVPCGASLRASSQQGAGQHAQCMCSPLRQPSLA